MTMTVTSSLETVKVDKRTEKSYRRRRLREIMGILHRYEIAKGVTPVKIRHIIEDLGPTFVKLGQVLSMRQDILPPEYCHELAKLQTNVSPLPFSTIKTVMESEYGRKIKDVFKSIDEKPLGSASIAQVHQGILLDGTEVVVKVQRPGIYETMSMDIALLYRATDLLKLAGATAGGTIDFRMILDELWVTAKQEMDFLIEAKNADTFAANNKDVIYVECPVIYHHYTTPKVLVMSYIPGVDINEVEALEDLGYDLRDIAAKLCENYIKQIVNDGFFQADPHPGNIRIDGGKIAWIDLGMMGTLSHREMKLYREAISALASKNVEQLKAIILAIGVHHGHINHARLYADIDDMVTEYGDLDLGNINLGTIMEETLQIAGYHHIAMPKGMTMLARGVMTFEGVIGQLDPDTNIIQILAAHLENESLGHIDVRKKTLELLHNAYSAQSNILDIPRYTVDALKMALRGQAKVNLEITGSEEPLNRIEQMINRIVTALIAAALLIGSSFISTTAMTPRLLGIPALGALGYFVAVILGLYLVFDIYHTKWKNHRRRR